MNDLQTLNTKTLAGLPPADFTWRYYRPAIPVTDDQLAEVPRRQILVGDALDQLRRLPTASVDTCITSPPYYLLRDYRVNGQLGLEANVDEWVGNLRAVLREVARVLKPTGALWLNLGDSFSRAKRYGAAPKSLLLTPERLLFALMNDGWIVRNKVIWAKPNPMPHSVTDRLNTTYEYVYFLVRSRSYYFSLDEIREPHRSRRRPSSARTTKYTSSDRRWAGPLAGSNSGLAKAQAEGRAGHPLGANPGDVWTVATGGYKSAHLATFPERLVTRPLLATCPERVCANCGQPWQREDPGRLLNQLDGIRKLQSSCDCQADWTPGVVLDPFFGSGTLGVVAEQHSRDWIGIELNPAYAQLAEERLRVEREKRERAA
jgi:DNA modification methylase